MNLKPILASAAFALSVALPMAASAADAPAEPQKTAADKPMQQHSHMQEKTGMSAKAQEGKKEPKKPLHDHQKEHK